MDFGPQHIWVRAIFGEFKKSRALKSPFKNFRREVRQGREMTPSFKTLQVFVAFMVDFVQYFLLAVYQKNPSADRKSRAKHRLSRAVQLLESAVCLNMRALKFC